MKRNGRAVVALCVMFAMVHAFNALYNTFMPLYLADMEFSASERGALLSIGAITAVLFNTMWGSVADRAKNRVNVMKVLAAGLLFTSALFFAAKLPFVKNTGGQGFFASNGAMLVTALALALYAFFQKPMVALIDTISMEYIKENKPKIRYGIIRTTGTLSFVIAAYAVGLLIERSHLGTSVIFFVYAALCVILLLALSGIPKVSGFGGTVAPSAKKPSAKGLFRDKWFTVMLISVLIVSCAYGFNVSYFPNYLRDTLGATESVIGISSALGSVLEVFLFLVMHKIIKKLGIPNLFMLCLFAVTIRWLATSLTTSVPILITVQFFTHPFTCGVLFYVVAVYVQNSVDPKLHATGTAIVNMAMFSLGRVVGSFFGGLAVDIAGEDNIRIVYFWCFALCLAVSAATAVLFRFFGWTPKNTPEELRLDGDSVV